MSKKIMLFAFILLGTFLMTACSESPRQQSALQTALSLEQTAETVLSQSSKTNRELYRDVKITVVNNDGLVARVQVTAEFRPYTNAEWKDRMVQIECRKVEDAWQCAEDRAVAVPVYGDFLDGLRRLSEQYGMEFVNVPGGEFMMGSTDDQADAAMEACNATFDCPQALFRKEVPQREVYLDEYWIGQTEVTNEQYRAFVETGGYDDESLWTETGWKWRDSEGVSAPQCWDEAHLTQPELPVVCVSWYEAVAYARWLARETGLDVRLPTEAEWEKAARGTAGRTWPWGEESPDGNRANYCDDNCPYRWKDEDVDDGYKYTAPVGSYAAGASPYGALDMIGNVGEWTSSKNMDYPYDASDGREDPEDSSDYRSLRGGMWRYPKILLRCAARDSALPNSRTEYFGFRVVLSAGL